MTFDPDAAAVDPETTTWTPSALTESATDSLARLVDLIREFIAVKARLVALDVETKDLKAREKSLSSQVEEMLLTSGGESPPSVDGMTAYFTPTFYVENRVNEETGQKFTAEEIDQALIDSGFAEMVTTRHNASSLRALLREFEESGQEVPEPLARVVTLSSYRRLAVTPAGAKKRRGSPRRPSD